MNELKRKNMTLIWGMFFISLVSVFALWKYSRPLTIEWQNVPPAPTQTTALALSLGDEQFSYRFLGMMLQSFGNTSGRFEVFEDYDYSALYDWFLLLDNIDSRPEYLPYLATYYFGSSSIDEQIKVITKFLELVGSRSGRKKWKWLTQAVYLARYRLKDLEHAQYLARKLSNHSDPDVGAWARNLNSYIMAEMGDKEAAINLTLMLLKNNAHEMSRQEISLLTGHVCEDLLDELERQKFEMCSNY
jgi:hypothetical protein